MVGDLRRHHLTQMGPSLKYTLPTRIAVRHRATKHLHDKRWKMIRLFERRSEKGKSSKSIPLPREVIDKQVNVARQPRRVFKHRPSPLSAKAAMNKLGTGLVADVKETFGETSEEIEAEAETRKPKTALFTSIDEVENFRKRLNDIDNGKILKDNKKTAEANKRWEVAMARTEESRKTAKPSQEKAVRFAAPVVTELRYYKAEDDESEEDEFEDESEDESGEDTDDFTIEDSDDVEMDDESEEDVEGDPPTSYMPNLKRKRESEVPHESPDQSEKRKKQRTATSSSQVQTARRWKNLGPYKEGKTALHHFFCRSSSLAAVFQAAIEVEAIETPQESPADALELNSFELEIVEEIEEPQDSSVDAPELDEIDRMLLGEQPSDPDRKQPSSDEDFGILVGEVLWPGVSPTDIRIASAGAKLLNIHGRNSELDWANRQALKKAFGDSD